MKYLLVAVHHSGKKPDRQSFPGDLSLRVFTSAQHSDPISGLSNKDLSPPAVFSLA